MGRASKELMANSLRESGGGRLEEDGLGTRVTLEHTSSKIY